MKDEKDKPADPKTGNVYLVNKNQKKDDENSRAHPDTKQHEPKSNQKGNDPLSIGESDGSAG